MRTRSLNTGVVCALVGSVLTVLIGQLAAADPIGATGPPSTLPAEDSEGQGIEFVDGLGSGGQPDGIPRELVIADARFLFDRIVPLGRQDLVRVAQVQETIAYATTEGAPFAAIYLSVPNRSEDELARYLPEGVGSPDVACPAEAGNYERVDMDGSLYAFAGIESDLTTDSLQEVGNSNEGPAYSDPGSTQPFPELFFGSGEGLLRFVLVGPDSRPAPIAGSLVFNGTEFAFDSDTTDTVDPAALTKVGCSTAFPVYTPADTADGSITQLYVLAGTRLLLFTSEQAAPADETPPPPTTTTLPPTTTTSTTTTTTVPATIPSTSTTTTTEPPTTTTATTPPTTTTTEPPTTTTTEPPTTTTSSTTTTEPPTTTTSTTTSSTTTTEPPTTTTSSATTTEPPTTTTTTETSTTTEPPTTTTTTETSTTIGTSTTTSIGTSTTTSPTSTTEPPPITTTPTSTTTAGIGPPAVVPTLPPNAPSPAASTAIPTTCSGDPGELNAQGIPAHLPTRIQLGGVAYLLVRAEAPDGVGTLTRIGCIGPFELARTDQADQAQVIYLRSTGSDAANQPVYRFEVALTYQIELQVIEQPQVITTADQRYRLGQAWQPSAYSSTSVILFVQDAANPAPEVIYGVNVSQTVVGDAIGEYRQTGETAQPSEEMSAAAEQAGLNPDLTISGQIYILVNVYTPTGTTRNGFMTLFGTTTAGTPEMLLGRDQRELELFIFVLDAPAETGG